MNGELRTDGYQSIKQAYDSEQQQLSAYTGQPTLIAVVRLPGETGITRVCDEWWPELGMPERHLKRFVKYKSGFRTNSAVDNPTRRAYEEARLDYHYNRHIRTSEKAQRAVDDVVRRLSEGEDITLVCFEKDAQNCHRSVLRDIIDSRRTSEYQFGQTLSVES